MPSKTWMRSRVPSTTLAETRTVSPGASSGRSVRSWSCDDLVEHVQRRSPRSAGGSRGGAHAARGAERRGGDRRRSIARRPATSSRPGRPEPPPSASTGALRPRPPSASTVPLLADVGQQPPPRGTAGARGGRAGARAVRADATRGAASDGPRRGRRNQDVGHAMPRNTAGRVYCGYSEQPAREGLVLGRGGVDRARQQAQDGVDDDERRQLAAGQHVVADRELEVDQRADPLVDALVARAHEDEVLRARRGPAARAWRKRSPPGSSRIDARESGRRSASSAAATGSGRRTMPAPPPYG